MFISLVVQIAQSLFNALKRCGINVKQTLSNSTILPMISPVTVPRLTLTAFSTSEIVKALQP